MKQKVLAYRRTVSGSRSKASLPATLALLTNQAFTIYFKNRDKFCSGVVLEEFGKQSRMFSCIMAKGGDVVPRKLTQVQLCVEMGLKHNDDLRPCMLLNSMGFTIGQLTDRIGTLLAARVEPEAFADSM